jgi:hypothetical protein
VANKTELVDFDQKSIGGQCPLNTLAIVNKAKIQYVKFFFEKSKGRLSKSSQ